MPEPSPAPDKTNESEETKSSSAGEKRQEESGRNDTPHVNSEPSPNQTQLPIKPSEQSANQTALGKSFLLCM